METTRTFDLLERIMKKFPKEDTLAGKQNGKWIKYNTKEYIDYVNYISYGLLSLGFKKGDKIATITNNRPEWNFVDLGMAQIGVIHVPVYPTIGPEEYEYILNHSQVKAVIFSTKLIWNKIRDIVKEQQSIEKIYSFNKIEDIPSWSEIIQAGKKNENKFSEQVKELKSGMDKHDMVTLIYT